MTIATRLPTILPHYRASEPSRLRSAMIFLAKILCACAYGAMVVILPPTSVLLLGIPIGVMLLVTLWMLPDRRTFPLETIERVFPIFFGFYALWPVYIAIALPGLPWLTPTRMVLFVLVFLLVYSVSSSSILRRHLLTVARASRPMWLCFLGWEIMQIVTLPFSRTPGLSFKSMLDNQISVASIFFLGCLLFARRGWPQRIAVMIVVLATVAAIDGFVELRMGHPPWAEHIPSFMRVDAATMANVLGAQSRSGDGLYRVHGMSPNSLLFAEYLALSMPFVLHWMYTGRTLAVRGLMVVVFVTIFICIVLTQARLGLVGVIIGLLVYSPLWALRRWRHNRTSILAPAIVLGFPAIAALFMLVVLSSHTMSQRVFGGGAQAASDESRRTQRKMAIPKIVRNPVGYGLGQSGVVVNFISAGGFMTIDNGYISTTIDLGVIGFISFYGLFGFAALNGAGLYLRESESESELGGPIATAMAAFTVIRMVVSQEQNHPLVFLMASMVLALLAREKHLVDSNGIFAEPAGHDTPNLPASAPIAARIAG